MFRPVVGQLPPALAAVPRQPRAAPGAAGYFQYFGEAAGGSGRSFFLPDRRLAGPDARLERRCHARFTAHEFVRQELTTTRLPCTMAVFHHPLFTSGPNGPNIFMRDIWGLLESNDADVVVAGHDHLYERFGKQDVDGRSDARGLRQFIAGTGGARLYDFHRVSPNSQARVKAHGCCA